MNIKAKITATLVNSRVLRSGEQRGETAHGVQVFALADDGVPVQFSVTGHKSKADAEAFASQYPAGSEVVVQYVTRDPLYLEPHQLVAVKPSK